VSFAPLILHEEDGLQGYALAILQKSHDEVKKVVGALNKHFENRAEYVPEVTEVFGR
jgi:hypothetical protein